MSSTIPTTGQISIKQIREYIGLNNTVHCSDETTPLSLKQVFFSPSNSIILANNRLYLSHLRGCKFAAYTNSTRTSVVGSSIANKIDGTLTLYLGLSSPIENSGYGRSGLLYTRNRGLPIKLDIQATSADLRNLSLDTYSGTSNKFNWYTLSGTSFTVTNEITYFRLYTDIGTSSEFIIRIIPMLDGKTEGTGAHIIMMSLVYHDGGGSSEDSSEFGRFPIR